MRAERRRKTERTSYIHHDNVDGSWQWRRPGSHPAQPKWTGKYAVLQGMRKSDGTRIKSFPARKGNDNLRTYILAETNAEMEYQSVATAAYPEIEAVKQKPSNTTAG